jgi:hypothetical protein
MMHKLGFLGITFAAALALALPAGATPPVSETVTESAVESVSCDGFDAVLERNFSGLVTVYFDNQGNPVRVQVHATMTGSLTNSVTGTSLPLRGHILLVDNFTSGVVTFVGPVFLANDPGRGAVITDTGRVSFSGDEIVFEAGPHDANDNPEVLCTAVA